MSCSKSEDENLFVCTVYNIKRLLLFGCITLNLDYYYGNFKASDNGCIHVYYRSTMTEKDCLQVTSFYYCHFELVVAPVQKIDN